MDVAQLAGYGLRFFGLGLIVCFGVLALVPTVHAATQSEVTQIIADEAAKNGHVPLPMALAVAKVESDMRDDAVSSAGARGVMQMMPGTAMSEFGVPASALGDARLNVKLGIAYLERLHNHYGGDWQLALSHYNGGALPVTAGHYVAHDYTRQYVADVMKWADIYRNDATLMAELANPGTMQLASLEPAPAGDAIPVETGTVTPIETAPIAEAVPPPAPAQAPAPTVIGALKPAAVAKPVAVADDTTYPSASELRARFRASLGRTREASVEPADTAAGRATAPAARASRFTYAPYGGG